MVWREEDIGLADYRIDGCRLLKEGRELITFPTPISEIARLGDRLFVIIHPYPALQDPEYAGTNLWAISHDGRILWKAPNLNATRTRDYPDIYRGMTLYDHEAPKLRVGQWDDHALTILDAFTGRPLPELRKVDWNLAQKNIIIEGVGVLAALPHDPPEKSQLPEVMLSDIARKLIGRGPAPVQDPETREAQLEAERQATLNEGRVWFGEPKKLG